MKQRTAFFMVLTSAVLLASDKIPHVYQQGTITGWTTQHYSRAYSIGGRVSSAPGHKKFYELKGIGMKYQLDDCGSFTAGQAVNYRVEGNKLYIQKENGKEHKCRIEGVSTEDSPSAPAIQK